MRPTLAIDLPPHDGPGGFDHAMIHRDRSLLYVAHTANSAIDVIDTAASQYSHSISGLTGVAGALVNEKWDLVFTSNRGENTVGIFSPDDEASLSKVPCCVRPNGLSFDEERGILLAAGVGEPYSLTLIDVKERREIHSIASPGRTRWTVYDKKTDSFYVNVGDPAVILVVRGGDPSGIARTIPIPAAGPHGLDIDAATGRLFCACDAGRFVCLNALSAEVLGGCDLSGVPDVIWFNPALKRLYVAVGDPGVIDVIDTDSLSMIEVVQTEKGAHTTAIDLQRNLIYAFCPQSCRATVFSDV
jgi:DNA-binding beta-propeller fold protein YncE